MNKARKIRDQLSTIESIDDISHILENIASIRIRQIRDEVLASREFFQRLWAIFSQLRVSEKEAKKRKVQQKSSRQAVVVVTANAGLTGEVDSKVIQTTLTNTDPKQTDFFVYGLHGESIMLQLGVKPTKVFRFPEIGSPIEVNECIEAVSIYQKPLVYYPSYSSLLSQEISKIELFSAVQMIGSRKTDLDRSQIIFEDNTIFEPSITEIVDYLESMMASAILTEIILESNLAQYASRFNAMTVAGTRAADMEKRLRRKYLATKRYESDEANRRYTKRKVMA